MTTKNEQDPVEPADASEKADHTRRLVRFANYTSPVMLAMLASAGKDVAFAQVSPR